MARWDVNVCALGERFRSAAVDVLLIAHRSFRGLKLKRKAMEATEVTAYTEFTDERWKIRDDIISSRISSSLVISGFSVAPFSLRQGFGRWTI